MWLYVECVKPCSQMLPKALQANLTKSARLMMAHATSSATVPMSMRATASGDSSTSFALHKGSASLHDG